MFANLLCNFIFFTRLSNDFFLLLLHDNTEIIRLNRESLAKYEFVMCSLYNESMRFIELEHRPEKFYAVLLGWSKIYRAILSSQWFKIYSIILYSQSTIRSIHTDAMVLW